MKMKTEDKNDYFSDDGQTSRMDKSTKIMKTIDNTKNYKLYNIKNNTQEKKKKLYELIRHP